MKNIIQVFTLLLFMGAICPTAKSDTFIRYILCQNNVNKIEVVPQGNQYSLHIALTGSATEDFLRLTRDNLGKTLNIEFEDVLVSCAVIDAPIKSGYILSIPATEEEANKLMKRILNGHNKTPCGKVK
jgi:preprotein translocase subunit SecD